jgi:hypothetical protein
MVMSCSENAVIIEAIDAVVFASSRPSWPRLRVTGSDVRARSSRLPISARMRSGSASMPAMWSQTTWSA